MKKLLISVIIAAAVVSCSEREFIGAVEEEGPRLISLSLDMEASEVSKVAFGGADIEIGGLQYLRKDAPTTPTSFAGSTVIGGTRAVGGNVNLVPAQYYANASNKAYLVGYYPAGTITAEVVTWPVDATTDIMTTTVGDAGTDVAPLVPNMTFNHELCQVEVICKPELNQQAATQSRWGNITAIAFKSATNTMTYTYSTLAVAKGAGTANIPFVKPDYTAAFVAMAMPVSGNTAVNAAGMFVPTGASTFVLTVTTANKGAQDVTVTLDAGATLTKGKKYTVTLTFNTKSIAVKATIAPWTSGGTGSGALN